MVAMFGRDVIDVLVAFVIWHAAVKQLGLVVWFGGDTQWLGLCLDVRRLCTFKYRTHGGIAIYLSDDGVCSGLGDLQSQFVVVAMAGFGGDGRGDLVGQARWVMVLGRLCHDPLTTAQVRFHLGETQMSSHMSDENKRWNAKRKSALVWEIIQGKTTSSL